MIQDLRYALRALLRGGAFTALAVLCLGLGIGINTGMFSLVHAMLFRPLPFAEDDRLATIWSTDERRGVTDAGIAYADLLDLRQLGLFAEVGGFTERNFTLTAGDQPERVAGAAITPNLFPMLGVRPQQGRNFREDEAAAAGFEQVALISDGLWRRAFGEDPGIVGKPIHINGRTLTIVGVMPRGFRFPTTTDLWLPLGSANPTGRNARSIAGLGRLSEGVTFEGADAAVKQLAARWQREMPDTNREWSLRALRYRDSVIDANAQKLMYIMLGAVAFVLLIACANVANLLLARATDRAKEIAVRAALGASRARIVQQLLTESVLLALAGAALGVLLSMWWVDAMMRTIPEELPYWLRITVDRTVLVYTLLIALATGLLFGLVPALQATRPDLQARLRDSGRSATQTQTQNRLRSALVVGEIALSLVLLVGAALMVQSFLRLQSADAGFRTDRVLSLRMTLAGDQYDALAARTNYLQNTAQRLAELPGVSAAAGTLSIPADDGGFYTPVRTESDSRPADEALVATEIASGLGLMDALGLKLLAGRDFTRQELHDTTARVVILGEQLARQLFPQGDAVGRRLRVGEQQLYTVVGIAPNVQYEEFSESNDQDRRQFYVPFAQWGGRTMAFLVRTDGDPNLLKNAVREELKRIDPTVAAFDIMTMDERRLYTTWPQRVFGKTFGTFGGLALVLAVAGVYGVMAYSVARRRREIGVRIALGARPGDVLGLVVGRAAYLAGTGVAIGLAVALVVSRLLSGLIFGVSASDPLTFLITSLVLASSALLASYVPALRATRVDPMEALRSE